MRHWRIYNLFMTTCYMYKITIIIIIILFILFCFICIVIKKTLY